MPRPRRPEPLEELAVPPGDAGRRLDRFLRILRPAVPLSAVYRLIRRGPVRVNGERRGPEYRLRASDVIRLPAPDSPAPPRRPPPPGRRLPVLHEDEDLLALNKPAGLVVHAGTGPHQLTVLDLLPPAPAGGALSYRPALVHRLDRQTSGLLLVGKSPRGLKGLNELFRARRVDKRYLALVGGRRPRHGQTITAPVGGRAAATLVRVREKFRAWTLVAATIHTGRTHQIRRHLAEIEAPVAGDGRYGRRELNRRAREELGLRRMFLHAWRLGLDHPGTGKRLELEAPLPPELEAALERARK